MTTVADETRSLTEQTSFLLYDRVSGYPSLAVSCLSSHFSDWWGTGIEFDVCQNCQLALRRRKPPQKVAGQAIIIDFTGTVKNSRQRWYWRAYYSGDDEWYHTAKHAYAEILSLKTDAKDVVIQAAISDKLVPAPENVSAIQCTYDRGSVYRIIKYRQMAVSTSRSNTR